METLKTLLIVLALLGAWEMAWWAAGVGLTAPWSLKGRMRASAQQPPLLVDVRTPAEYRWFHIPGARNLPEVIADTSSLDGVDRDRELVVVCMTGHRSPIAAWQLKKAGFRDVRHLTGGMVGWVAALGPVRSGASEDPR